MNYSPTAQSFPQHDTPLSAIDQCLLDQRASIEQWFISQWRKTTPPFYGSIDVRHAGFKLAPVDTNLFPAGFNNLHRSVYPLAADAIYHTLSRIMPEARHILLIPENHTRNKHYLENISCLCELIEQAGFIVQVGSLLPDLKERAVIPLPSGRHITLNPIVRQQDLITVEHFIPEIIISNNDFSSGIPDLLQAIEQPIIPSLGLGWSSRLKSLHFLHYERIVQTFAQQFSLDPWQIMPLFRHCGDVNFLKREGERCLLRNSNLLSQILAQKYQQYHLDPAPFMVIKADQGTYGMAVIMIRTPEEIIQLNRKRRARMAAIKGGRAVSQVIIQEGIPTIDRWHNEAQEDIAEMVIYLIGERVIGAFYRAHPKGGIDKNLNKPGMYFVPLEMRKQNEHPLMDHFYPYTVVARLAQLAASLEAKEILAQR